MNTQSWGKAIALGAGLLVMWFLFEEARWYTFQGRLNEALVLFTPKKPTVDDVDKIRPRLVETARAMHYDPASVTFDVRLVQHDSRGRAAREDISKCYWFVVVNATRKGRTVTWETRIENELPETDAEALVAKGYAIEKIETAERRPDGAPAKPMKNW